MELDWKRIALAVIGALVVGTACVPSLKLGSVLTASLIAFGTTMMAVALVLPRLSVSELEVALPGVKAKIAQQEFHRTFAPRAEDLQSFAWLASGDPVEARNLVEDALAETRRQGRNLPSSERDTFVLRVLVERLDTSSDRRLLLPVLGQRVRGLDEQPPVEVSEAQAALIARFAKLELRIRIAYLLRVTFELPSAEVAHIVGRPQTEVEGDVERARRRLKQLVAGRA
jgi:DNA-directed RNA polymerase specialized sigma24 family protein